jgi:hypothetical protein
MTAHLPRNPENLVGLADEIGGLSSKSLSRMHYPETCNISFRSKPTGSPELMSDQGRRGRVARLNGQQLDVARPPIRGPCADLSDTLPLLGATPKDCQNEPR